MLITYPLYYIIYVQKFSWYRYSLGIHYTCIWLLLYTFTLLEPTFTLYYYLEVKTILMAFISIPRCCVVWYFGLTLFDLFDIVNSTPFIWATTVFKRAVQAVELTCTVVMVAVYFYLADVEVIVRGWGSTLWYYGKLVTHDVFFIPVFNTYHKRWGLFAWNIRQWCRIVVLRHSFFEAFNTCSDGKNCEWRSNMLSVEFIHVIFFWETNWRSITELLYIWAYNFFTNLYIALQIAKIVSYYNFITVC